MVPPAWRVTRRAPSSWKRWLNASPRRIRPTRGLGRLVLEETSHANNLTTSNLIRQLWNHETPTAENVATAVRIPRRSKLNLQTRNRTQEPHKIIPTQPHRRKLLAYSTDQTSCFQITASLRNRHSLHCHYAPNDTTNTILVQPLS